MPEKPSYEELEQRIKELENVTFSLKRSEEGLHRSAGRFRRLFEQASDSFFVHDFNNSKIVDANESACKNLGYTRDELLELNVSDIEISQTPEAIVDICARAEKGRSVIVEGIHRRKDGSTFPVEISLGMLQDENPALLLAIARDTTERKKTKEALRESEGKYRGLIEGLDEAIYRMSLPDGKYEYMSSAAKKIFGYSAEEFIENPLIIGKLIHPDFAGYFKEKWADLIEHKISPTYKYKILDPEGNERWIVQSNTGIFDDSGNIIAIEGLCRDITKGAQAEKELQESEEKFRTFTEMAPVGVFVTDTDGLTTYWNKRLCEITAMRVVDGLGTGWADGVHPDDRERVFKEWYQSAEKRASFSCEYRFVDRDGAVTHTIGQASPLIDASSRVTGYVGTITDVTDLKQAEVALRESEDFFTQMFVQSKTSTQLFDPDGTCIRVNPEFCNLFGVTEKDITSGYNVFNDQAATDSGVVPLVRQIFDDKKANKWQINFDIETASVSTNTHSTRKEKIWIDVLGYPVLHKNGSLQYVVLQNYDITEQKQAEEALRESQGKYKALFSNAQVALFRTRVSDGKLVQINERYAKMAGYSNVEDCMAEFNAADAWANPNARNELLRILKENGSVNDFETEIIRRNGSRIWILFSATIFPKRGVFEGSIVDISERKQVEEALRESESRHRQFVENAVLGLFQVTKEGQFLMSNQRMAKIFGYDSQQDFLSGVGNISELYVNPEERQEILQEIDERGHIDGREMSFKRKDGDPIFCNAYVRSTQNEDGKYIYEGLLEDVTEKKNMVAQLQQVNKMESIATLAGGVAHEFNNALMGVIGNIELLKMDLPLDEGRHKTLDTMNTAGHRMSRLTDQLLAYAKGGKYHPKNLKLDDFVIETLPILEHDLNPTVRVETHLQKDISFISADNAQMQMVLSAILSNSNEAIEDEGTIRITAENKNLDEHFTKLHPGLEPGYYVCLTVEDDGRGMDEETKRGIFEPFFTTKFQGRGMGMAAVYGIVRNHDGGIYVDSELGTGTTVRIYLPAIEVEIEKPKEAKAEVSTGSGTILMIEDEDVVIEVTQAMLEMLGYRVMVAKTGKDAIHIAETFDGEIDLALLDIKLPDIDGRNLYPLIMKARSNLKVIVFSGYSIDGPAREILDEGAQGFIQKPFSLAALSDTLKEVLGGE